MGLSAAPSLTSKALHEAVQPYWEGIAWYIHLPRGRNGAQRWFFLGTTFVFSILDDQYREKSVAGLARGVGCLHPNNFSMKFFP